MRGRFPVGSPGVVKNDVGICRRRFFLGRVFIALPHREQVRVDQGELALA